MLLQVYKKNFFHKFNKWYTKQNTPTGNYRETVLSVQRTLYQYWADWNAVIIYG